MIRKLIALLAGLAVAIILISLIQKLGHGFYPPPSDVDLNDQAFMREYIASLPWGPLAFVLASYVAGALIGGWLAASIAQESALLIAGIVGLFVLAGAVVTMIAIPHPTWFSVASVIGIILAVLIAAKLASGVSVRRKIY